MRRGQSVASQVVRGPRMLLHHSGDFITSNLLTPQTRFFSSLLNLINPTTEGKNREGKRKQE